METKSLIKSSTNLPVFVQDAYESVEKMKNFSNLLLESKLVPDHLYEKGADNKPDYTKGKTAAVMMILLQGHQLNLPPLTALQHIIPVNGLLSIKGDAAKSLIFNSGKLQPGTWKETVEGDIEKGDYKVTITAQRSDTKETLTRSFSVSDAKRAGLWITEKQINGADGWKYKKSAWFKFPSRMCAYRCLGFISRDLFPDVLNGIYTTEEAIDLPTETEMIIETAEGAKITIPDKQFDEERSNKLTSKAAQQIDKINKPQETRPDAATIPVKDEQATTSPEKEEPKVFRLDELNRMGLPELRTIISENNKMKLAVTTSTRKNTAKKYREIIMAFQNGKLDQWIDDELKAISNTTEEEKLSDGAKNDAEDDMELEPVNDEGEDNVIEEAGVVENEEEQPGDITPVTDFYEQQGGEIIEGNKFEIEITDIGENGRRGFDDLSRIYQEFDNIAGVNGRVYDNVIAEKFPELAKEYKDKEDFCTRAPKDVINKFLNSIEKN